MVEADAIERVEQREAALDLMRLDHAFEDVLNSDVLALAREVVRDGEDCAQVVGRVAPWNERLPISRGEWWGRNRSNAHSAARKQSLKSSQRTMVPMLKAPRIGSSW